jgi:putative flavoprotein involved in K+ transport
VIIGGGQAGLAVGYHLAKRGRPFVSLDANQRIGGCLAPPLGLAAAVHPGRYSSLPGMAFPASAWSYPTKDQVADYLEA